MVARRKTHWLRPPSRSQEGVHTMIRVSRSHSFPVIFALGLAILVVIVLPRITRGQSTGATGGIGQFDGAFVVSTELECTTSLDFVDMPGMSKNFFVAEHGPAAVLFQAQFIDGQDYVSPPELSRVQIKLLVDSIEVAQSRMLTALSGQFFHETHGMNFVTDRLASGSHNTKIEWRSQVPAERTDLTRGNSVCLFGPRSLLMLHH